MIIPIYGSLIAISDNGGQLNLKKINIELYNKLNELGYIVYNAIAYIDNSNGYSKIIHNKILNQVKM